MEIGGQDPQAKQEAMEFDNENEHGLEFEQKQRDFNRAKSMAYQRREAVAGGIEGSNLELRRKTEDSKIDEESEINQTHQQSEFFVNPRESNLSQIFSSELNFME